MTIPAKQQTASPATIEDVLMRGDLSSLSQEQRLEYYNRVCQSLGLNPLTRPFDYLILNGKLQLYARRDAADQLRRIRGISIEIVSQEFDHGLLTVHVRAKDKDGRSDEDLGVVAFPDTLKGEIAANAILKAVTKAKRRVTLSLSGLGYLDETEVADIPASEKQEPPAIELAPRPLAIPLMENNTKDWRAFATELLTVIKSSGDRVSWLQENMKALENMKISVPKMHQNLMTAIDEVV